MKLSYFNPPITNTVPSKELSLLDVIKLIKTDELYQLTSDLRNLPDEKKSDFKKNRFPGVTFSGVFSKRTDSSIISNSSLIAVDIDKIGEEKANSIKEKMTANSPIVLCFTSPSGDGIKMIFKVDSKKHTTRDNYEAACSYIRKHFGIEDQHLDTSCSNVSRLCFLCHDPNAWVNSILLENTIEEIAELYDEMYADNTPEFNRSELIENVFTSDPYLRNAKLDFQHKGSEHNFSILLTLTQRRKGDYVKGNRHTFIQYLCSLANQFGMPKNYLNRYLFEFASKHISTNDKGDPFDIDGELFHIIDDTYTRYQSQFSSWQEEEVNEQIETPTIPDEVYDELPNIIAKPCSLFVNNREKDVFFLSMLGVLSNWMPKIQGKYDGRLHGANMYFFISAPASAGKGVLIWSRKLTKYIQNHLKDKYRSDLQEYEVELAKYEAAVKAGEKGEKPIKPSKQKFIIPGNISSSAIISCIEANNNFGLIFETEADSLTVALNNDWGNFSDTLRKGFHHEPIQLTRKTNSEDIEIERPYLSMVLSGTPNQIERLISSIENGVFSRIIFYDFPLRIEWHDVFSDRNTGFEEFFDQYARLLHRIFEPYFNKPIYNIEDLTLFEFTSEQQAKFNCWFEKKQSELAHIYGNDIVPSIRRLGVSFFRIAMIFTATRQIEKNNLDPSKYGSENKLICLDVDYANAERIVDTVLFHTIKIYNQVKGKRRNQYLKGRNQLFIEKLPNHFTRQDAMKLATYLGIKEKTAESYLSKYINQNQIKRIEHNSYAKLT